MEPPSNLIGLPEGQLELSIIVDTSVKNNASSFKNKAKLESLQSWIQQQSDLNK